jgi:hypothetical protein
MLLEGSESCVLGLLDGFSKKCPPESFEIHEVKFWLWQRFYCRTKLVGTNSRNNVDIEDL